MGLCAVAGVAALADRIARCHAIPRFHGHGSATQVREEHDGSRIEPDCDVIPRDGRCPAAGPSGLTEEVRDARDDRAPCRMIRLAIVGHHDGSGDRCENGLSESEKALRRFGRDERAPVERPRPASGIDGDEVDRKSRSEGVRAVTGNPSCGTVAGDPGAAKRWDEYDGHSGCLP